MDTFYFALKKNKVIDAMKTCFKYALNNDHAFNHTCNFTNGKTNTTTTKLAIFLHLHLAKDPTQIQLANEMLGNQSPKETHSMRILKICLKC